MALMQLTHHSQEQRLGQCISKIYHHTQGTSLDAFKQHCFREICQIVALGPSYWLIEDTEGNLLAQTLLTTNTVACPEALDDSLIARLQTVPANGMANKLDDSIFSKQRSACALAVKQADSNLIHRFLFFPAQKDTSLDEEQLQQLQFIAPHLATATRLKTLQNARLKRRGNYVAHAICDHSGSILEMSESFRAVLSEQIPEWQCINLPFSPSTTHSFVIEENCIFYIEPLLGYWSVEVMHFDNMFCQLSNKEKQICFLLKKHFKNKQIAEELGISQKTVDNHLTNIYKKTGLSSRHAVIANLK